MKGEPNMYHPNPMNLDAVAIPEELQALIEDAARNVHEVWASGRIADGWVYGELRNDAKKETPCLVPYEELPEAEKQFDRETALGTLKYVLAAGYRIIKA